VRIWPALFLPPISFLAMLSIAYALVPWACETQHRLVLHLPPVLALGVAAGAIYYAWRSWQSLGGEPPTDSADETVHGRFVTVLALMLSSLIAVGTLALWFANAVLEPCMR
jgi:hypothetical protein